MTSAACFCVRMVCAAVPRDDRTAVFTGQWEAYDPARDGQGNRGPIQVLFLYSKLLEAPLIDCPANPFLYVLPQLQGVCKKKRLSGRQQEFSCWQNFGHNCHLHCPTR